MLDKTASGSLSLRKLARKKSLTARAAGLAWKGVKRVAKKHPIGTAAAALGVASLPGVYRKAKPRIELASPYNPENVYPSTYWERPR